MSGQETKAERLEEAPASQADASASSANSAANIEARLDRIDGEIAEIKTSQQRALDAVYDYAKDLGREVCILGRIR